MKLPAFDPGGQLGQAVTYSTGGVAADANGFFHPLGDHAQVSFVIDGQPISDQQSKVFSTQLPTNAIQTMELITGTPDAEFGDKSSLVVNVTTRSGLGVAATFGSVNATYGAFGTPGGIAALGFGKAKIGNFLASTEYGAAVSWTPPNSRPSTTTATTRASSTGSTGSPPGERTPPEPVHGAELVPDPEHLRPLHPGPEPARTDVVLRSRLPAHLQRSHPVDHQSLYPQRPSQLLCEP